MSSSSDKPNPANPEPLHDTEPMPLVRMAPAGAPYPMAALGPLRRAAEALHDITQAPPAIAAHSVLGVASLAVQGIADAETLHGSAPSSLYLLTIAQTGERKSACDRRAMAAVRAFEAELADIQRKEIAAHRFMLDIWRKRYDKILRSALADPENAKRELAELGPEPESPLLPSIVSDAPTLEGLTKNFGAMRPSLGIFADDAGTFIGGYGMQAEHRLKTMAGFSGLWDGSPTSRWRAQDGVTYQKGRRISMHLMTQPVAAAGLLADPVANGQGFLARFLVSEPASTIGARLRTGHMDESDIVLASFNAKVGALLRFPLALADGARNELAPRMLKLAAHARIGLEEFARAAEQAQAPGGDLENVRPFASKAAEHAARLGAVMALFDDPETEVVSATTMRDAIELVLFYIKEARRLADRATISRETEDAERLRRWLVEKWPEQFISASDAAQSGPFPETERARRALAVLERHDWVKRAPGKVIIRGKVRREAWRIWRGRV
ncbi:YfjI family protein [Salinarimonas ramus]|uniref:DUF3987 domain-containing protein n=1 Tax=Salinarimonas ramus TaxID=690164 RepID=A0A917V9I9_9HYPH|nr:YfjI family protein [Salinarimonas ramus]GGK51738.1 hypothetical protein GCM10011322_43460 [Salinarimonas ramus]